ERRRAALGASAPAFEDAGEGGELVGQRLARRRAGRQDDVLAVARGLGRDRLVSPQVGDPAPPERVDDGGGRRGGPARGRRPTPWQRAEVAERVLTPRPCRQPLAERGDAAATERLPGRRVLRDTPHPTSLAKATDSARGSVWGFSPRFAGP